MHTQKKNTKATINEIDPEALFGCISFYIFLSIQTLVYSLHTCFVLFYIKKISIRALFAYLDRNCLVSTSSAHKNCLFYAI